MAWRRRGTSIDVDLSDFDDEQLLQQLVDSGWITEAEAEAITVRANNRKCWAAVLSSGPDWAAVLSSGPDADALAKAIDELHRGRVDEARLYLERFLGSEWNGVLHHA